MGGPGADLRRLCSTSKKAEALEWYNNVNSINIDISSVFSTFSAYWNLRQADTQFPTVRLQMQWSSLGTPRKGWLKTTPYSFFAKGFRVFVVGYLPNQSSLKLPFPQGYLEGPGG